MKRIKIILIALLSMLGIYFVRANTPCGNALECTQKARPYMFCNEDGKIAILCAENPLLFSGIYPYFSDYTIPLKFNNSFLPLCLEFDGSGPDSTIISKICGNYECHTGLIYNKVDFVRDMKIAEQMWKCICGWEENDCGCTVKIGFVSFNHNEFMDPEHDYSNNTVYQQLNRDDKGEYSLNSTMSNPPVHNCQINCNDLRIFLNNTKEFTHQSVGEENFYEKFYTSGSICETWDFDFWNGAVPSESKNLRNLIAMKLVKYMA